MHPIRPNTEAAMGDMTSKFWLYAKGFLFLLSGSMAAALLILEQPTLKVAVLLALCVWCFARAYYFCFYVIEHYIDPHYRFAGLWDFAKYALRRHQSRTASHPPTDHQT